MATVINVGFWVFYVSATGGLLFWGSTRLWLLCTHKPIVHIPLREKILFGILPALSIAIGAIAVYWLIRYVSL